MNATKKYYALVPEKGESNLNLILESYMVEMSYQFTLSRLRPAGWRQWQYMGRFCLLVWLEGEIASAPAKAAISLN